MTLLFIGTTELLVIGGVALLIFGGKKLPELMRGLGRGVKEFKEGMNEPRQDETNDEPKDATPDADQTSQDVDNAPEDKQLEK